MIDAQALAVAVAAVCPIDGISIGDATDRSTWAAQFKSAANDAQKQSAAAVIATWVNPRLALGSALRDALKAQGWDASWQTALTGQSQDTRDWWTSGYREQIPDSAKKLVRIAASCIPPVDLDKLYTAAGS